MGVYRNGIGQLKRTKAPARNVRRLHLQCQVTQGGALPPAQERSLRRRLAKALKLEKLTGRKWERLVEKRRRAV